jgi:hypothetical protein
MLFLQLFHHLCLVLALLHAQICIVLVRELFPFFLLKLIFVSEFLETLLNFDFLFSVIHDLLQTHGQSVFLQMLLVDLLLSCLSLTDFIYVRGFIVAAHHESLFLGLSLLRNLLLMLAWVMHLELVRVLLIL